MKSSASSSSSFSCSSPCSSSSCSSLNASAVQSFHFSPCRMGDDTPLYNIPFKDHHPHSQSEISEVFSSDGEAESRRRRKPTLGELMKLHSPPSSSEEEEELLLSRSRIQPGRLLLVHALFGTRKATKESSDPRSLQRSTTSTRRRCNTPSPLSPLRNSTSETSTGSTCCGGMTKNNVVNHVVNSTVVRSRSSGSFPRKPGPGLEFLTKSKSMGAAGQAPPIPKTPGGAAKSSGRSSPNPPGLFQSRSRSSSSTRNPLQGRNSSGRRSYLTKINSVSSSSSNTSLLSAIDRYQQHKNSEAENKRRNSFLPYKSALLSLFFPLPSFWCHHQPAVHHHHHVTILRGT